MRRAWTAAIGPALDRIPDASRTVLIPMGELVRIPWHAGSSGVCGRGDDEAFSLSTTLLANNVATVVGTQWSVPDAATSVLMFMFHHYLRQENLPPAEALRRAQLWMIAPNHRPPATMPAQLRALTTRSEPVPPTEWAAFVHFGR